jgi:hypothetical protein
MYVHVCIVWVRVRVGASKPGILVNEYLSLSKLKSQE